MNERIKELYLQAGINRVDLHYTEEQPPYTIVSYRGSPDNTDPLAKFAELIVRECADIAYSRCDTESGDDILKKFGVEE
jgi:hypothetical protein